MQWNDENLVKILKEGGVVVMPTDTIYGIVGRAEMSSIVDRIYKIRKRDINKPCIVLIGNINELEKFGIILLEKQKNVIKNFSVPISFILDCPDEKFKYLHRSTKSLAFRIPLSELLQDLLMKTGPLIAPSANIEDLPPAQTILEARKYFGDLVDLYVDGGILRGKASQVIKLHKDGSMGILRE